MTQNSIEKLDELEKMKKRHCWPKDSLADAYEGGFESGYKQGHAAGKADVIDDVLAQFIEERRQLITCGNLGILTKHGEGQVASWTAAIRILGRSR